ncbi:hypothetical protein N2152v2_002709 [Parachlorella kessleri]
MLDDDVARVQELLARIKAEAEEASAQPAVPTGLAAAVLELSDRLGLYSDNESLDKTILAAAGGSQLAVDLQHVFCSGTLLTRLCSRAAVEQDPAAVTAFLRGLTSVVEALPSAAVDFVALRDVAGYIDDALAIAEHHHNAEAGSNTTSTLLAAQQHAMCQKMREAFVIFAFRCMQAPGAAERWGLSPASPALEPMLHLALGQLSAACQLAAEQPVGLAALPSKVRRQLLEQQPELEILANAHGKAWGAASLSRRLLATALEAAAQGRLNLQRLMLRAPGFIKVLDHYATQTTPQKHPHPRIQGLGVIGLVIVLLLQQRLFRYLTTPLPSQTDYPVLERAMAQRMQWIVAAAGLARLLHSTDIDAAALSPARGSSSSSGSGGERGWW